MAEDNSDPQNPSSVESDKSDKGSDVVSDGRNVYCLNCGHTWITRSNKPQCSICRSSRVVDYDKRHEYEKDIFDVILSKEPKEAKEVEKETKEAKQEVKEEPKEEKEEKGIKAKLKNALLIIGMFFFLMFFVVYFLRGYRKQPKKKQIQEEEYNPYSALGG